MSWKNQSGGPWGSGPRGPWGNGPQSSGPNPADIEDLIRRGQDRLRGMLPGGFGSTKGVLALVALAIVIWLLSGFYRVQPDEQGVVLRFGKFVATSNPGLNYHLPYPVETVLTPKVTRINRIDIGSRSGDDPRRGTAMRDVPEESLMLTGDENIVDVDFAVFWMVKPAAAGSTQDVGAADYLFNVQNPEGTIKAVAESAMREVVGKSDLQAILTTGRGQVQAQTAELMQRTLDSWGAGISVVEVQIRSANPPAEVAAAFRDVNSAGQDQESARNEANTYRNRVVNEAKGDAAKLIQSAEGYREQAVREATGDVARFNQIYNEYRRAPGVTKDRLYIETMQRVLQNSNKVIIDGKGASAPIILPPDVFRPRSTPRPAGEAAPTAAAPAAEAPTTGAAR